MYFFSLSMSLANKLRILLEIMLGLLFLKRNGIIHLDIKPDNVLISKGLQCKISDFGEAYHETLKGYKVTGSRYFTQGIRFLMFHPNCWIPNPPSLIKWTFLASE